MELIDKLYLTSLVILACQIIYFKLTEYDSVKPWDKYIALLTFINALITPCYAIFAIWNS